MIFFRKKTRDILSQFGEAEIIAQSVGANLFGVRSMGVTQLRGNGVLVLTRDELYFKMWVGKREVRIPVKHIRGIENPTGFLGKWRSGPPLIQVNFLNERGEDDAAAWQMAKPAEFQQALSTLIEDEKDSF